MKDKIKKCVLNDEKTAQNSQDNPENFVRSLLIWILGPKFFPREFSVLAVEVKFFEQQNWSLFLVCRDKLQFVSTGSKKQ